METDPVEEGLDSANRVGIAEVQDKGRGMLVFPQGEWATAGSQRGVQLG